MCGNNPLYYNAGMPFSQEIERQRAFFAYLKLIWNFWRISVDCVFLFGLVFLPMIQDVHTYLHLKFKHPLFISNTIPYLRSFSTRRISFVYFFICFSWRILWKLQSTKNIKHQFTKLFELNWSSIPFLIPNDSWVFSVVKKLISWNTCAWIINFFHFRKMPPKESLTQFRRCCKCLKISNETVKKWKKKIVAFGN